MANTPLEPTVEKRAGCSATNQSQNKGTRGSDLLRKMVPPARFQRATFRLGVSAGTFACVIFVYHKPLNQPIFID
jgi:hypothetical protein